MGNWGAGWVAGAHSRLCVIQKQEQFSNWGAKSIYLQERQIKMSPRTGVLDIWQTAG